MAYILLEKSQNLWCWGRYCWWPASVLDWSQRTSSKFSWCYRWYDACMLLVTKLINYWQVMLLNLLIIMMLIGWTWIFSFFWGAWVNLSLRSSFWAFDPKEWSGSLIAIESASQKIVLDVFMHTLAKDCSAKHTLLYMLSICCFFMASWLLASDQLFWSKVASFTLSSDCGSVNFMTAVERGLTELRKLGIEQQLWEGSRADIDQASLAMENQ